VRGGIGTTKTPISKIQYGITPEKNLTKKQVIIFWVSCVVLVGLAVWFAYYYNRAESILPPEMHSENQTYEQVIDFIRSDDTDTIPYEFGFNCVDATFRIWRSATWQGITAYPIVIQYNDSPGHMVIAFPTNDRGDVFIEPQNDLQIKLRVGQNYDGREIRGIYILDYTPLPLGNSPPYDPNIKPE
jgi:hypothetical protein